MGGKKQISGNISPQPEAGSQVSFAVNGSEAGDRLDRVVTARYPELSRTRVKELIEGGLVLVEGKPSKGSHRLHGGEKVEVNPQKRPPLHAHAESIPLDILYEDADIIAVNKPAGMTVHAGAGNTSGTLVNALLGRGQTLSQGGDALRPGIVHRLDKETSGVILVAKTDFAHARLGDAFRRRVIDKIYIALVQGSFEQNSGRIELPIGRDPLRRVRMAVQQKTWHGAKLGNPRDARTDWRTLLRIDGTTLLEVQLHTGRTHQIRVHLSAKGHPIAGDDFYGGASRWRGIRVRALREALAGLTRPLLHAQRVEIPEMGIDVTAPLPGDYEEILASLAQSRSARTI